LLSDGDEVKSNFGEKTLLSGGDEVKSNFGEKK
jgi:hypothetical protein